MTVSIIVPVYNVQEYLGKCLRSIINQTYKDIQIILVNDGSTDDSGNICDSFALVDSRIEVIHKINGGLSDARNAGIEVAKGKWITFIDSDDYVTENYVQYLMELIEKNNADISIATYTYVTEQKNISHETGEVAIMDTETALRRMLLDDGFDMGAWAKMYRTSYFHSVVYPKGKLFEDSFTTYRIISQGEKIVFGSKSIYFYINRANSIVNNSFNERKLDLIEMNELNESFIKTHFPKIALEAHRRTIWAYFSTLNQVILSEDKNVVEKFAPSLVDYLLSQGNFILKNPFNPTRDKIAYVLLKFFGLEGYKRAWKTYLKLTK